jgi:gluconokinase
MIVIIMGAAGAGKSTVGRGLADALGWRFIDADDMHPPSNVEKIRSGLALTDEDRVPWLERTHDALLRATREQTDAVLACSALRERYRATLADGVADVRWVFLDADANLLEQRLRGRPNHFAGPAIVESQLETLEPPADSLRLRADLPVSVLVKAIRIHLGR